MSAAYVQRRLGEVLAGLDGSLQALGAVRKGFEIVHPGRHGRVTLALRGTTTSHRAPLVDGMVRLEVEGLARAKRLLAARGEEVSDLLLVCPLHYLIPELVDVDLTADVGWMALGQMLARRTSEILRQGALLLDLSGFVNAYDKGEVLAIEARSTDFGCGNILIAYASVGRLADGLKLVRQFKPFAKRSDAKRAIAAADSVQEKSLQSQLSEILVRG